MIICVLISTIVSTGKPDTKRKEIKTCIAYKFSLQALITMKMLDYTTDKAETARLSRALATAQVRPEHRLVFIYIALEKNLLAQNYGLASHYIKVNIITFTVKSHIINGTC
jgi:hypothetical protein